MAKEAKNKKKSLASKLVMPFGVLLGLVVTALVIIINPFNIPKIIKNNYPKDAFKG